MLVNVLCILILRIKMIYTYKWSISHYGLCVEYNSINLTAEYCCI